jgi:uncharacterized protein involved in exopolysaccharide biosynthesis
MLKTTNDTQYTLGSKHHWESAISLFLLTSSLTIIFIGKATAANPAQKQVKPSPSKDLKKPCENYQQEKVRLENQLTESETNVKAAEKNIRDFREKHQITDIDAESVSYIEIINYLNKEITIASDQLTFVKSHIAKIQSIIAPIQIERSLAELQSSGLQESMIIDYVKTDIQRVALEYRIAAFNYVVNAYRNRAEKMPQLKQYQKWLDRQWNESLTNYKKSYTQLDDFQVEHLENQFSNPRSADKVLKKRLLAKRTKIREYEEKIRIFREKYQAGDIAQEAVQILGKINTFNIEISIASAQKAAGKYAVYKMRQLLGNNFLSIREVATLSEYSELETIINISQEYRSQLVLERSLFGDSHPSVTDLRRKILVSDTYIKRTYEKYLLSKIPNIKTALQKKLVLEYIQAESNNIVLDQQIDASLEVSKTYRDRANRLPEIEKNQRELTRQLEVQLTSYKDLAVRLQNPNRPFGHAPNCRKSVSALLL